MAREGCDVIAEIPGWPGYAVTDEGHVLSFWARRNVGRKRISVIVDDAHMVATFDRKDRTGKLTGYRSVCLSLKGKHRNVYVHEIVLRVFVGPRPSPVHEALHGNGDRGDNRLDNLRWGTVQENADDRERHGHVHRGDAWYRARGLPPPWARPEPEITAQPMAPYDRSVDGDDEDSHAFSDLLER